MSIARTAATWLWTQIRKELTIQSVPPQRPPLTEYVPSRKENKILKNGLNGFAMLLLITVAVAVLVL